MHYGENILKGELTTMRGRKPYREEWKIFDKHNLDSREWLVQKANTWVMYIVHKETGEVKVLDL